MARVPGNIKSFLNLSYEHAGFIEECAQFFSAHVDLLDSILAIVKGGKHLQQIIKLTLQQVSTLLDEADHGVYVVLQM